MPLSWKIAAGVFSSRLLVTSQCLETHPNLPQAATTHMALTSLYHLKIRFMEIQNKSDQAYHPQSRLPYKSAGIPDCEEDGVKLEHQDGLLLADMQIKHS